MNSEAVPVKKLALLAEDDAIFRRLLAKKLTVAGFEVREAENGLVAKTIFDLTPEAFAFVITDVKMPELDGVQLIAHLRKNSKVPVLVMTGFSEILESKAAFELGANGFLPKPFKADTLISVVTQALNPKRSDVTRETESASRFCQIHISEFISSSHLISDLYIKLSEAKFVKVAHRGDAIPIERLKVYQERNVDFLYVTQDDFAKYVEFNIKLSKRAFENAQLSNEIKAKLLQNTTQAIVEKCFISEIDAATLNPAKQMVENTLQLAGEDNAILDLIASFESHANKVYSHSVAVSFFACLIARQHGWNSANTLFKVSMSGLLHDIGKKELPPELLQKSRLQLSATEIRFLETHPLRGRDILSRIPSLPEDIAVIVAQHHENIYGSGYPLRIKGEAVHPIARILAVADRFCSMTLPLDAAVMKVSPREAAIKIKKFYSDELDEKFVLDLLKILKVDENAPGRSIAS